MKSVYIDIGCNRGYYAFEWLKMKDVMVYAFEPNPDLYALLKAKEAENFKVFDYAIDKEEGTKTFNIGQNDATSSLKKFDKDFTAFGYSHSIGVKVMRLDTFFTLHSIERVDFLKIDAQGSDLDVLKSMGDQIKKVKKIMVEAFIYNDENVYEDEVKEGQVIDYLTPFGFKLINRAVDNNYCDLTFEQI